MSVPRRWTTEMQVLAELERLGDRGMEEVSEFYGKAERAAAAEVAHKTLRAQRVLLAKADSPKVSAVHAEAVADSDPDVAAAYRERLITQAALEAARETLRMIRTNQDGLRTAVASHRSPLGS